MVVQTGQSLSLGHGSSPVIDSSPIYPSDALMFASGTRCGLTNIRDPTQVLKLSALKAFTGLYESIQEDAGAGLTFSLNDRAPYQVLYASLGVSSQPYPQLKKGTQRYSNRMSP
jgi:hypothetical protein